MELGYDKMNIMINNNQRMGEKKIVFNDIFEQNNKNEVDLEIKNENCYTCCNLCFGNCFGILRMWLPCVCCCCPYPYKIVEQYEQGVLQHFGKFVGVLKPGIHFITPFVADLYTYDIRTKVN